jgi:pilus assembly protein Flp/PilA
MLSITKSAKEKLIKNTITIDKVVATNLSKGKLMNNTILKLYVKAQAARNILVNEEGQDLIEYALVVALIAFAAVAGMNTVATDINLAFTKIGGKLTLYTS